MNYELYYLITWPYSQKIQDAVPKKYWSFTDCDTTAGVFVEKEWFDKHKKEYGF